MLLPEAPLATEPEILESWEQDVRGLGKQIFHPSPRLTLSEWADEHGKLSDGQSWKTSVVPYLREIMDAVSDRSIREVVVMKSARVGYTEGILGQRIGYCMHQDPRRILVVQPTEKDAKDWSQKQLAKMIQESETLRRILPEPRGRDSGNTILDKTYDGGSITIRGAKSPQGLRRHTADDVIFDEVDGYDVSSSDEGDPIMLGTRAVRTVPDRKIVMGSTPKLKMSSRILKALKGSDWREYHVPCPHCEELQILQWGGPEKEFGIKWGKEVACKTCGAIAGEELEECGECGATEFDLDHLPETAHYVCEHCGEPIEERDKTWMLAAGEWVPRHPGRKVVGFHLPGTYSPFEGGSWENMVREFLKAKDDPALLQVWVNQWLGEPYEERGEEASTDDLEDRAEQYVDADEEIIEVPDGVGVLTAAVDVHPDWIELLVRGWGVEEESWDVFHERIHGDAEAQNTWARLEALLTKTYEHASGTPMRISCTMIDAGYATDTVYSFVKPREQRNVFAIQGDRTGRPDHEPLKRPTEANADGVKVWRAGTYKGKDLLFRRLRIQRPGPRYMHLRSYTPELCNGFDGEYFKQFGAEKKVPRRIPKSRKMEYRFVEVRRRNEAIDLHVYNRAAFLALGQGVRTKLGELVEAAREGPSGKKKRKRRRGRVRHKGVDV